jgi:hypothetical protein
LSTQWRDRRARSVQHGGCGSPLMLPAPYSIPAPDIARRVARSAIPNTIAIWSLCAMLAAISGCGARLETDYMGLDSEDLLGGHVPSVPAPPLLAAGTATQRWAGRSDTCGWR